jgi:hypothetical protein
MPVKVKARLVFPSCLRLNNFNVQEETYFPFFEGGLSEAGQDRRVVARRCNHCVSRFLTFSYFYLYRLLFSGLWARLVLARAPYVLSGYTYRKSHWLKSVYSLLSLPLVSKRMWVIPWSRPRARSGL